MLAKGEDEKYQGEVMRLRAGGEGANPRHDKPMLPRGEMSPSLA
jgi:hypothetical protein